MAATTNFAVNSGLMDAFLDAQDRLTRIITVKIEGEEMVLDAKINKQLTAQQDFDVLLNETLTDTEARFAFFSISDHVGEKLSWLFLMWIPDTAQVRDKMLYSSSRDNLKRGIGYGYFSSEYSSNDRESLRWSEYVASLKKDHSASILSDTEIMILEEQALVQNESSELRSTAMGSLPFEITPPLIEQLQAFNSGTVNWVEMTLAGETVDLVKAQTVPDFDKYAKHVNAENASFIAVKLAKLNGEYGTFFVFSCPEEAPIRTKMVMSSSKASVLAVAQQQGISFDKTMEIRSAAEIDEQLQMEVEQSVFDSVNAAAGGKDLNSSAAANIAHTKPHRPGKGKPRVAKFSA